MSSDDGQFQVVGLGAAKQRVRERTAPHLLHPGCLHTHLFLLCRWYVELYGIPKERGDGSEIRWLVHSLGE